MTHLLLALLLAGPASEGHVSVENGKLAYDVRGQGPAVLLIHGGFGDRRMWDDQLPALEGYRVIRLDLRGYGRSSEPRTPYQAALDFVRLLDELKVERAHVVGNSMGGTLALDLALCAPQRVASLTLVAATPAGWSLPEEDRARMREVFTDAKERGLEKTAELWLQNPMVKVSSKDARTADRLRRMVFDNRKVFLTRFWPETVEPPAAGRLSEVKAPTLIVVGDQGLASFQEAADAMAKGIAGARKHVISGADHLPQMTHPDAFNGVLKAFLAAQGR